MAPENPRGVPWFRVLLESPFPGRRNGISALNIRLTLPRAGYPARGQGTEHHCEIRAAVHSK
jgi:hypothetical protein